MGSYAMEEYFEIICNFYLNSMFLFLVILILCTWNFWFSPANLPPGPKGIPLVGYFLFLKSKGHVHFKELAKEYGDIFSMYLGRKLVVVLNSHEAIKEAFVKQSENFSGRPKGDVLKTNEIPTIFEAEGNIWRDYKRFTLRSFRQFGLGKRTLETFIQEEAKYLLEEISKFYNRPNDIGNLLRMSVANVTCSLIDRRFEYHDPKFHRLINILGNLMEGTSALEYRTFFPYTTKIPYLSALCFNLSFRKYAKQLTEDVSTWIDNRASTYQSGCQSDFMASWFTEAENRAPENGQNFSNQHLAHVLQSLLIAGTDTTANSIRWGLLYLMENPHIQQRLQKEIDDVIGCDRVPFLADRCHMPYMEATIMEMQRISSIVPLAILHCNRHQTTLKNFVIPKRTIIIANLWSVHFDPEVFPEPQLFRPERFLDQSGNVVKNENLIPFSLGKRQCMGESLANMELFLFFASMLQKVSFCKPDGDHLSFDCKLTSVLIPKPFKVIAVLRNNFEKSNIEKCN